MRFAVVLYTIFGCGVISIAQAAQQPALPSPVATYDGVTPLATNEPPLPEKARTARVLTWPGFERNADGCYRVFFQLSESAQWTSEKNANGIAITFKNTKVHLRNTLRPLDTTYFDAPVTMVDVERKGKDVVAYIALRNLDQSPRLRAITQEQTGYYFLLAEFKCADGMPAPKPEKNQSE